MATIVVFASSLSIASLLVLSKAIELRFGRRNIFLTLIGKLDNKAIWFVGFLKFKSLQLVQIIRYIVLVKSKIVFRELFNKVQVKITDEYQKRQNIMMGRKDIKNNGSVSFYLKKISEEKGNGEKGKIE